MFRTSDLIVALAIAASGGIGSVVDLKTRRVPNPLTLLTTASGLALAGLGVSGVSLLGAMAACILGLALMLPGHVIGATGAGDVKLFAALATFLGPGRTVAAFLYAALAGGVLALAMAAMRQTLAGTVSRTAVFVRTGGANAAEIERTAVNNRFAYAPAIAIGAIAAVLAPIGG